MATASKYGRLFTEADAIEMVRVCITMQTNPPSDAVAREMAEKAVREWPDATFPADEPLFLLRAQDQAALDALIGGQDYEDACRDAGASSRHLEAIQAAADEFHAWQRAHPERVKVPD